MFPSLGSADSSDSKAEAVGRVTEWRGLSSSFGQFLRIMFRMTHWMDVIGGAIAQRPQMYEPLFSGGWGDPDISEKLEHAMPVGRSLEPIDLKGSLVSESASQRVTRLRFLSPAATFLPKSSEFASALLVEPLGATGMTIMFAAFNDHGFATRLRMGQRALAAGQTLLILENPFYGSRLPQPGRQPMRQVSDVLLMGFSAVVEAQSLASFFEKTHLITYAGYSMGGNIAALAAATSVVPSGCAALAASHSPGPVFAEGILNKAIDWDALGGPHHEKIQRELGRGSVLNYPAPRHHAPALIVGVSGDGYIPKSATTALSDHWPLAELRWMDGGHASALFYRKAQLGSYIVEASERFRIWNSTSHEGSG